MQRYHATGCGSAVNNTTIGGPSARDASRADSSSLQANYPRRPPSLTPYKLKCDREHLNFRLGPPDFHPQNPNCLEETLTREYVQSGYRETVEGLEDVREVSLTQIHLFTKPVVIKCREAIRKCLKAINESRAQKRKAGQVYGVPLSGSLLTKPGAFPEQRPCGEDFKKKWIEGLSQPHKRLCSLSDHVPHGYRKRSRFEVLIRNNVPLLKATWFIKVTYLNQVRPSSVCISSGAVDKTQLARTELWTKDVIEYLQYLLDEFFSRNTSHSALHSRDRSPQMLYTGSVQQRSSPSPGVDGEEPSLHFKWWYVVRLMHWQHSEGLLLPSAIVDWVLGQLQEKPLLEILQLLLPIIYGVLETVVLSQTYVRTLAGIALRFIQEYSPGGSDLVDNSRRAYTTSALIEMLRYLILAVPDTFVALDCFPLPPSVVSYVVNDGTFVPKATEEARKTKDNPSEVTHAFQNKGFDSQYQSLSFDLVVSSIQKRADNLAMAASPGFLVHNVAKTVQALDKVLSHGDIRGSYNSLFENFCDGAVDEHWIEEVSPCLRSSLKWIGTVSSSFIRSVFFLCEWATCDYRDFWAALPHGLKFTGRKDFSQVYVASRLLKLKARDLQGPPQLNGERSIGVNNLAKSLSKQNNFGGVITGNGYENKNNVKGMIGKKTNTSDIFESPGPLHDIIVCWIDQHEASKGEGLKRVQLLVVELVRDGIFYPLAYVRQLIISGIMDTNGPVTDFDRRKRHHRILKHLPGLFIHEVLEEAWVIEESQLSEAMHVYSNERRLLLRGLLCVRDKSLTKLSILDQKPKPHPSSGKGGSSSASFDQCKTIQSQSSILTYKENKIGANIEELKASISVLLQLPNCCTLSETGLDECQGGVKRIAESICNKMDLAEVIPGCEDCRKAKRQKLNEDKSSSLQGNSPISDDEDSWWVQRGLKSTDYSKTDPPTKSYKHVSKGRQKVVRKTQSLAQLAVSRIEGSQGASSSHVCDNKLSCPHHRTGTEGETHRSIGGIGVMHGGDIVSIGKALKQLRFVEKRIITVWLMTAVKQLVEENEKNAVKVSQFTRPFAPVDDRSSIRWKLGEDELSAILYLMDVCNDLVSATKLLIWLLPKVLSNPNFTINSGRNIMMLPRNLENNACEVGEVFLLSSLQRYENILVALELMPEVLSAAMQRISVLLASNGRLSGSVTLIYSRNVLKKYGNVPIVFEWEKNFKAKCDKRFLSELESFRLFDEVGVVQPGAEDPDDVLRQRMAINRLSRLGISIRDVVQRHIDDSFQFVFGKEKKLIGAGVPKGPSLDKSEDVYQVVQQIMTGVMDCIRQRPGNAQEGDPSLVSYAVSAIVNNVGPTLAKMPDFSVGNSYSNASSAMGSLSFARRILRIHISCLCLLKELLGERQSRCFEVAFAAEASSALATAFAPGKASRSPFQLSPEAHDSNPNISNDILNHSTKAALGRGTKNAAAISALVIGAIIHGVISLERMLTLLRLKEGLDVIQFVRSMKSNSNGNTHFKVDNSVEVCVHWFRLLVGNCRTLCDGLIVELVGEPSVVALSRVQQMLPLSLVLPPAYSIFAFVVWRPFILNNSLATREDIHQLYQSLTVAMGDVIKHLPFRDVCLRDGQGFYDLVSADPCDADFASLLELNGLEMQMKSMAFTPLRGRLFLNAIIDCKMPHEDENRVPGRGGPKGQRVESEMKLLDKLVNVLDALQPAKFHWQWVELRLLLNEQALIEKLETQDMPLADAIRSSSPGPDRAAASENENNFIEIILTRLLVRPDAAPLFAELVHRFGRSLEDSMLLQAKWFLGGPDVLFGRKTIRQRLINIAESKGLSTKARFRKPWGWFNSGFDSVTNKGDKKFEATSLEEGEVVEEGTDSKRSGKGSSQMFDSEVSSVSQQHVTERALIQLVVPCIDQASDDSRNTFASDLIKQLNNIEQQINAVTRGVSKQAGTGSSGLEGPANKGSNRKAVRGGSPGLARRATGAADSTLPSPAALRASMSLRLQLLLRMLPIICTDGEPSGRNMRHMLTSVVLRLLGNRVVYEDADLSFLPMQSSQSKREVELLVEIASAMNCPRPLLDWNDLSGESLFDRLLLVLHGLLSSCQPSWLKARPASKSSNELSKASFGLEREVVESLQNDLDRMHLPGVIRWRIQAAMPILHPPVRYALSCQPPSVPITAVALLQPSVMFSGFYAGNPPQRNPVPLARITTEAPGKPRPLPMRQDNEIELDPWTLLEDGTGSGQSSICTAVTGSGDHANLRASSWLKGSVRVRRTDLTYIGAVDDDS